MRNKLLKKIESFLWDKTCEQAFLVFKKTIATSPFLSLPRPGVPLLLYLSVVDEAVSSALLEEEGKQQFPIYFTSYILHDTKKHYQKIEKAANTHYLGPMTQALLPESSSSSQNELPHQASFAKA